MPTQTFGADRLSFLFITSFQSHGEEWGAPRDFRVQAVKRHRGGAQSSWKVCSGLALGMRALWEYTRAVGERGMAPLGAFIGIGRAGFLLM
jgi:hypothetical protein